MERKKLLVCGSAGFMMSNFIRYLLYMTRGTKEFEIVSIDKLININDYKRLYIHKDHKFYLGDISDEYFVERVLFIEKPDFIINGCFYNNNQCGINFEKIIKSTSNLLRSSIPIIQLNGCSEPSFDYYGFWKFISNMVVKNNGTIVEIPNSFGFRQRLAIYYTVPWTINELLNHKNITVRDKKVPWVYAEDVASLIWFMIENKKVGAFKMPPLGFLSEKDIAEEVKKILEIPVDIEITNNTIEPEYMVTKYDLSKIDGWSPDSENIYSSLEKTIKWFNVNKWAFNV